MNPTDAGTLTAPGRFEAVVFDFGGVFIESPFAVVAEAATRLAMTPETLSMIVFGSYDTDGDHPWHRLERGEITFDACRDEIMAVTAAERGAPIDVIEVLAALATGRIEVRAAMLELVTDLRAAGLRTSILTNNIAEFSSTWRRLLDVDGLFDDVVDSSAVGLRKPDVRIYELAAERLGVSPASCLFLDDAPGNVAGAERAGMTAFHVGLEPGAPDVVVQRVRSLLLAGE